MADSFWCLAKLIQCFREDLGEQHWNMCNIMYETSCQSRFDARYWMLGAGALGRPRGILWGGRREESSGWGGTCIPVADSFWCLAKSLQCFRFKNKIKLKKKKAQHSENEDHGIWYHHFMGNRRGNSGNIVRLYFWGLQSHCRWWLQPWN